MNSPNTKWIEFTGILQFITESLIALAIIIIGAFFSFIW
jgi:hypothetical protein